MPNHVKNVWTMKNIEPDKIDYILNKTSMIYTQDYEMMPDTQERIIDFDLIVPQPRYKKDCPKQYIIKSARDAHLEEDSIRPWFDWYEWRHKYWDTKWNAYDGYTLIDRNANQITFVFNTAWNFPKPIAIALTKLGYDLELKYADECIGANCGEFIYNSKDDTIDYLTAKELDDPDKFAEDLWDNY